jgi:peptidoglycan/xylan/chitin deacetylase (PgdA/CDA1 family)
MRVRSITRRLLRLKVTTVWGLLYQHLQWSKTSSQTLKHIKIDDEERQYDENQAISFKDRSPLIHLLKMVLLTLLAILLVILLIAYIIYKPPNALIRFFQWRNPDVLFHHPLPPTKKVVGLTLDDAPSSSTGRILDLLEAYNAKATFFIIGSQVESHPDLIQRIHSAGHELGNHAEHDEPSLMLPLSELSRQIREVDALLPSNRNGLKYFRPGSGIFNQKMVDMVKNLGYRTVLGSIYPHDPQIHNPRANAKHVLSMVRPGGIIIMHDRRSYSYEQLELVLKGLKAGGWRVESLGGLLGIEASEREDPSRPD